MEFLKTYGAKALELTKWGASELYKSFLALFKTVAVWTAVVALLVTSAWIGAESMGPIVEKQKKIVAAMDKELKKAAEESEALQNRVKAARQEATEARTELAKLQAASKPKPAPAPEKSTPKPAPKKVVPVKAEAPKDQPWYCGPLIPC